MLQSQAATRHRLEATVCAAKVRYIEADRPQFIPESVNRARRGVQSHRNQCSGSGYGSGLISTLLSTLNTAVFADPNGQHEQNGLQTR